MRFLIFTLLLCAHICHAQYSDSVHYYAGIISTGNINKTALSQAYIFSNAVKLGVRHKQMAGNFNASWLFGEQQKVVTNNDFISTLDVNLYKTLPHFYYWGLGNYTVSKSLKINNQYQAGAGVAYNILDRKNAYLNISDGLLYESSDIVVADTVEYYSTYRNSFRVAFRFVVKNTVTISSMSFYQNSLQYSDDYIIRSNATLGVKVAKWLSLTASYTYNRYNRTNRENTLFNYGLTAEKYF